MRRFVAVASLLLVVGVAMPAAFAMSSTLVSVGGDTSPGTVAVTGFSDGDTYFENDWQTPFRCASAEMAVTIERGQLVTEDSVLGQIAGLTFDNCTMTALGIEFVISNNPGAWPVVATETPTNPGDPVAIEIQNASMYLHSPGNPPWGCEMDLVSNAIAGTYYPGATANGNDGRIETSTSSFSLAITAYNGLGTKTVNPPTVGGCAGQIYTRDSAHNPRILPTK